METTTRITAIIWILTPTRRKTSTIRKIQVVRSTEDESKKSESERKKAQKATTEN